MILCTLAILAGTLAQPAPDDPLAPFTSRLEALSPAEPESYFRLAEEVADASDGPERRRLVEQLYVLAFALDRRQPGRDALAASSCIALAGNARVDQRRRWLLAVARKLDPRQGGAPWMMQPAPTTQDSAAYQVATLLGYIRSGHGAHARQMLSKPDVRDAVRAYDRMLLLAGMSGTVGALERQAVSWPCVECSNQRVVRKPAGAPNEYRLCPTCNGNPGPRLSDKELLNQLRLESWLLQGSSSSWSAQLWIDLGEPLYDPEPDDVPVAFGVNPGQSLWRNGAWVAPTQDPAPAAPSNDPAPPETPSPEPTPSVGGG